MEGLDMPHKNMDKQDNVGAQESSPSDGVKVRVTISRPTPAMFLGRRV